MSGSPFDDAIERAKTEQAAAARRQEAWVQRAREAEAAGAQAAQDFDALKSDFLGRMVAARRSPPTQISLVMPAPGTSPPVRRSVWVGPPGLVVAGEGEIITYYTFAAAGHGEHRLAIDSEGRLYRGRSSNDDGRMFDFRETTPPRDPQSLGVWTEILARILVEQ